MRSQSQLVVATIKAFRCVNTEAKSKNQNENLTPKVASLTPNHKLCLLKHPNTHSKTPKKRSLSFSVLKQKLVFSSGLLVWKMMQCKKKKKRTERQEKGKVLLGGRISKPSKKGGRVQEPLTQSHTEEEEGLLGMNPPGLVLQQGRQQSDLCLPALLSGRFGRRSSGGRR